MYGIALFEHGHRSVDECIDSNELYVWNAGLGSSAVTDALLSNTNRHREHIEPRISNKKDNILFKRMIS